MSTRVEGRLSIIAEGYEDAAVLAFDLVRLFADADAGITVVGLDLVQVHVHEDED